jgi:hypothetical protein
MKTTTIAVLTALIGFATPALADRTAAAGACYSISDPDARAYCRAKAHSESAACYSIQRPDLKAMCLAEVRK